jgi:hypothetical protein
MTGDVIYKERHGSSGLSRLGYFNVRAGLIPAAVADMERAEEVDSRGIGQLAGTGA